MKKIWKFFRIPIGCLLPIPGLVILVWMFLQYDDYVREKYEKIQHVWRMPLMGKVTKKKFHHSLYAHIKDKNYKQIISINYDDGNVLFSRLVEIGDSVYKAPYTTYSTIMRSNSIWYAPLIDADSTYLSCIDSLEQTVQYKVTCRSLWHFWGGRIEGIIVWPLTPQKSEGYGDWDQKAPYEKSLFLKNGNMYLYVDPNFGHSVLRRVVQEGDSVYKEAGSVDGRVIRGDTSWTVPFIDSDCPCRLMDTTRNGGSV